MLEANARKEFAVIPPLYVVEIRYSHLAGDGSFREKKVQRVLSIQA